MKQITPQASRHDAPQTPAPQRRPCARRAFSLVEILVVVGILVLLMGIMAAAFSSRQGPASATRITLSALKAASAEYIVLNGESATSIRSNGYNAAVRTNYINGTTVGPKDTPPAVIMGDGITGETDFLQYSISRFAHQLLQYPTTYTMLTSLGRETLKDSDGDNFVDVLDGWGRKIVYYNPTSDFNKNTNQNQNYALKLPASRTPYFASAGPDGQWGDHRHVKTYLDNPSSLTAAQQLLAKEAMDNMYSYEMNN